MDKDQHFITQLQFQEQELFNLIAKTFPSGIMIDVGAHYGIVTKVFLTKGWKSYAFEPVAENLEKLKQDLGGIPNLVVRPEAVSNTSDYKDFYLALNKNGSLHEFHHSLEEIGEDDNHKKGKIVQVKTVSLNDLINQQEIPQKIEFLKIDTEGHDLKVLQGASQLKCQVISVEFWCDDHPFGTSPSPPEEMIQLLQQRGFNKYIVIEHKNHNQTSYLYLSIKDLEKNSWGNIFFFHSSQTQLYQDAVNLCHELESYSKSQEIEYLRNQNKFLQKTCDERLDLINRLDQAAKERLDLIQVLDAEVKRLQAQFKDY